MSLSRKENIAAAEAVVWEKYEREHNLDMSLAFRFGTSNPDDAEEIRHDAYVGALIAIREGRLKGSAQNVRKYIHSALVNRSRDTLRNLQTRRAHEVADADWEPDGQVHNVRSNDPDSSPESVVSTIVLHDALAKLPDRRRDAVMLEHDGYNNPEIAARLGTTELAARQLRFRAHEDIRQIIPNPKEMLTS